MIIISKFSTPCKVCKRQIKPGDRVSWQRGVKGAAHAACSDEGKAMQAAMKASRAVVADIDIPLPEGKELLDFQRAGIQFAVPRKNTLIADEMGLGKTVQAICYVNCVDVRNVLVVCPKSLKHNWKSEIGKWCVKKHQIRLIPGDFETLFSDDHYVKWTVINPEQFAKLPKEEFDLVIADEAHMYKNPEAKRTTGLMKICAGKNKIFLTGTPIENRPLELWPLVQMLAPETFDPPGFVKGNPVGAGKGAGFFKYVLRYCDAKKVAHNHKGDTHWDFSGSSNQAELQEKLRSTCMIRRLKRDVLKDLPSKRRRIITLEALKSPNEKQILLELGPVFDYDDALDKLYSKRIGFEEYSRVRHETGLLKVTAAVDFINDALETSPKIIVFAHHLDVVDELVKGLFGHGVVTITGATVDEERKRAVEVFQNDPRTRIIIGTIGAMSTGLTLTASSHVIFVEQDYTPSKMSQAEDRAHRIGQKNSVLIDILVTNGSIDAKMMELVVQKQEIIDMSLDDETMQDVSDRPVLDTSSSPLVDPNEERKVLAQLRYLASQCDGARELDNVGFNATDTNFGKSLAKLFKLSNKQLSFAKKILVKYHRQLENHEW